MRLAWAFAALLMVGAHGTSAAEPLSPEVSRLLRLPEDQIDLGEAALVFAKEAYPSLDVKAYSQRISLLADQAQQLTAGRNDPETRIRALNTVMRNNGFHFDLAPGAIDNTEDIYINRILDRHVGICSGLPVLYVSIAQRLHWPIYLVHAPDHIFARYVSFMATRPNIETTTRGQYISDEDYAHDFAVTPKGIKSGSYLRTLTKHEALADFLATNAGHFGKNKDFVRLIAYMEKAITINPRHADNYYELGKVYTAVAHYGGTRKDHIQPALDRAKWAFGKAQELGYVSREEITAARKGKKQ